MAISLLTVMFTKIATLFRQGKCIYNIQTVIIMLCILYLYFNYHKINKIFLNLKLGIQIKNDNLFSLILNKNNFLYRLEKITF